MCLTCGVWDESLVILTLVCLGNSFMGMTNPLVQGWSTEELLFSFDWVYNNMLSTYVPFIKLSVVHSPLNYNVRVVAEQHSCVNSVMVQLMLMKYGNIIKCIIVHCITWWELLKKGCDMLYCMERGVGGWHLIRKHGRGGRRGSERKVITELRSAWLFVAHKWDCYIITPPLQ